MKKEILRGYWLIGALCLTANGALGQAWNNDFAKRTIIRSEINQGFLSTILINASNLLATKETGEPAHAGSAGGASIWFEWTAPAAIVGHETTIDTIGSSFDTLLAVYTSVAPPTFATLALQASSDDVNTNAGQFQSRVTFVAANVTYYIAVDGYRAATGSVQLNIKARPVASNRPEYDNFAGRLNFFGSQIRTIGGAFTIEDCTLERDEPGGLYGVYPVPGKDDIKFDNMDHPTEYYSYSRSRDWVNGETYEGVVYTGVNFTQTEVVYPAGGIMVSPTDTSAWFSWTAPYSGEVFIRAEPYGGWGGYVQILQGTSMGFLTRLTTTRSGNFLPCYSMSGATSFMVEEGITYQIRVVRTSRDTPFSDLPDMPGPPTWTWDSWLTPAPEGNFDISINMYNEPPQVVMIDPKHDEIFSRQRISVKVHLYEADANLGLNPVINDPRILPFVDRVKVFAQRLLDDGSKQLDPSAGAILVGLAEEAPFEFEWVPPEPGDYGLWAVAEDDEMGYDPYSNSVYVISSQTTNSIVTNIRILENEPIGGGGLSLPVNPLTDNRTLAIEIYNDILGRDPTEAELADAVADLDAATLTAGGLAAQLIGGEGAGSEQQGLIRLYDNLLGRFPTPAEYATHLEELNNGAETLQSIAVELAGGPEFDATYGAMSDSAFISAIFYSMNGRYPTPYESDAWAALLTSGTYTRVEFFLRMVMPELYGGTPPDLGEYEEIAILYLTLFDQQPTHEMVESAGSVGSLLGGYFTNEDYVTRYFPDAVTYQDGVTTLYIDEVNGISFTVTGETIGAFLALPDYATWAAAQVPAIIGVMGANADADNFTNGAEYKMNTDPNNPAIPATIFFTHDGTNYYYQYPEELTHTEETLYTQMSIDGGVIWYTVGDPAAPSYIRDATDEIAATTVNAAARSVLITHRVTIRTPVIPLAQFRTTTLVK